MREHKSNCLASKSYCQCLFINKYQDNLGTLFGKVNEKIRWACGTSSSTIEDVSINHGRPYVTVVEGFLHRVDVAATFPQVCGEGAFDLSYQPMLGSQSPIRHFRITFHHAVSSSRTPSSFAIASRIRNFWILPVTVIGKESTNLMWRGIL